jgi:hypothetical protein
MSPTLARTPCGTLKDVKASAKYARMREIERDMVSLSQKKNVRSQSAPKQEEPTAVFVGRQRSVAGPD